METALSRKPTVIGGLSGIVQLVRTWVFDIHNDGSTPSAAAVREEADYPMCGENHPGIYLSVPTVIGGKTPFPKNCISSTV